MDVLDLILSALLTTATEDAVRCHEIDFALAVAGGDQAAFAAFLHPEVRFVSGQEPAEGRAEFVAQWAPFFAEDGPRIQWRPERVVELPGGEYAVSRGPFRMTFTDDSGAPAERWGEFLSVWQRSEEGWQVVYDAAAKDRMTPTEEQRALLDQGACDPK